VAEIFRKRLLRGRPVGLVKRRVKRWLKAPPPRSINDTTRLKVNAFTQHGPWSKNEAKPPPPPGSSDVKIGLEARGKRREGRLVRAGAAKKKRGGYRRVHSGSGPTWVEYKSLQGDKEWAPPLTEKERQKGGKEETQGFFQNQERGTETPGPWTTETKVWDRRAPFFVPAPPVFNLAPGFFFAWGEWFW